MRSTPAALAVAFALAGCPEAPPEGPRPCAQIGDCFQGQVCVAGSCAEPTCSDGLLDGAETDADCGPGCEPCADGKACFDNVHCASALCRHGKCVQPSCDDGLANAGETDVDCGGACAGCADGKRCAKPADCRSRLCVEGTCLPDADGDGHAPESAGGEDCDDSSSVVHPGAAESCNGLDDDCNGHVDEGVDKIFFLDEDGDGFGDAGETVKGCKAPDHYVEHGADCDDDDQDTHPGAAEKCDGHDDDCDGEVDEDAKLTFYRDQDLDKWGDAAQSLQACQAPFGYVTVAGDCDDGDWLVNPAMEDVCDGADEDCSGTPDDGPHRYSWFLDADGDGYGDGTKPSVESCDPVEGRSLWGNDCDDSDELIHPEADEACNGIDDDCSGAADEGARWTFWTDVDGDGYGAGATVEACVKPDGFATQAGDCDDSEAAINPGAKESCNGKDDDCDGGPDDGVKNTFYLDADGDGFGNLAKPIKACEQPEKHAATSDDCDDGAPAVHPGAEETCNGVDDDCDEAIDEEAKKTFYADADADGFGDPSKPVEACALPQGHAASSDDCDDGAKAVHPGADEACNGVDDDCDLDVDEGVKTTFYADTDADGYGDLSKPAEACALPQGHAASSDDCDDGAKSVHPGADEACNGVDDDCSGAADEGVKTRFFADADGDGHGDPARPLDACEKPQGYSADSDDCDDGKAAVYLGAAEVCDGLDSDCDGQLPSQEEDPDKDDKPNCADTDDDGDGVGDGQDPHPLDPARNVSPHVVVFVPGNAKLWVYASEGSTVTVEKDSGAASYSAVPGSPLALGADAAASLDVGSGTYRLTGTKPFLAFQAANPDGGDLATTAVAADGSQRAKTLIVWASRFIVVQSLDLAPGNVNAYRWVSGSWQLESNAILNSPNSAARVSANGPGLHKLVASNSAIAAYGHQQTNAMNCFTYLTATNGKEVGTEFHYAAHWNAGGVTDLFVSAISPNTTVVESGAASATATLADPGQVARFPGLAIDQNYVLKADKPVIAWFESNPNNGTCDGTVMDMDSVPAVDTGRELGRLFLFSTTWNPNGCYPERKPDLDVLSYADATHVKAEPLAGGSALSATLKRGERWRVFTDGAPNTSWRITSDQPINVVQTHATSEFAGNSFPFCESVVPTRAQGERCDPADVVDHCALGTGCKVGSAGYACAP